MYFFIDISIKFLYVFNMMIGDAMDRFLQLHGEKALARLMLRSKRLRVSGVKRTIGIPDNRKGKQTASVVDNIGRIKEKFADRIFCKSDLMSELGFTTGLHRFSRPRLPRPINSAS